MSKPNIEDIYPLSPLQEGMLFHWRLAPASGAYLEQAAIRVRGEMRPAEYGDAWRHVVNRHPALRCSFTWEKVPRPLQLVHREISLPVSVHDWCGMEAGEQERRVAELRRSERGTGFDLARAPLLRLAIVRTAREWSTAILTFHHILLDGWSLGVVLNEVLIAYEAFCDGRAPNLPPARPYREHVAWLAAADQGAPERFWREKLAGLRGATRLGLERPAPATSAGVDDFGRAALALPRADADALREVARTHKLTVGTLLHGAWAILLSRYAAAEQVVFGTTVSGRPAELPGVEGMVGLFINTVPVRVTVDAAAELEPWLHALHDAQSEVRQHGYAPLVEVHGWSEVPRDQLLFESLVVLENYPGDDGHTASRPLRHVSGDSPERTSYPLAIVAAPLEDRLELRATFDARRLAEADVQRVLGHLAALLGAMRTGGLRGRVGDLPMGTAPEQAIVLGPWRGSSSPYPRDRSIHALFREHARRAPHAVAVDAEGVALTYAELDARSDALAAVLRARGVGAEARVGIALERSPDLVVALLATLKAGAAYVPLDPQYPAARIAFMADDAGLALVLTDEAHRPTLPEMDAPVLSLDSGELAGASDIGAGLEAAGEAFVAPESLAYVIYTSGSTGLPKGSALPHHAIVRLVRDTDFVQLTAADRVAQVASISFDAATWEIWGALLNGGTLVMLPKHALLAPDTLAAAFRERRVTAGVLTTSLFNQVARQVPDAFAGLTHLMVGGEAADAAAMAAVHAAGPPRNLLNGYGPTESATFAVCHRVSQADTARFHVPIGRPIANTQAFVVDAAMRPLPPGVPGELLLGGDGLARGYLGRAGLTAERFIPNPWAAGERLYRTGDVARWLGDGTLDYLGRLDGQVKLRGYRVEPGEVEAALVSLPQVHGAAVGVVDDGHGERRLAAWVVPAPGAEVDAAALRAALRRTLPDWMLPASFTVMEAFPLTPNGKLDRAALPQPVGGEARETYVAPRDPQEAAVCAAFAAVLGVERVGIHDDFFAIGGHSLRATQVVSRLRDALLAEVPLADLFANPTPAALAARIRAGEDDVMAALLAEMEGLSEDEVRAELGEPT